MKALAVVHAETDYVTFIGDRTDRAFSAIGRELGGYAERGKAYFLAGDSESPDSGLIHPSIRGHLPGMVFVPNYCDGLAQFFAAKELMMADGVTHADIAGVAYHCCLREFLSILLCEDSDLIRHRLGGTRECLDWTGERFESAQRHVLSASIREGLTDCALEI